MLHKAEATSAVTDFIMLPFKPTHPPRSSLLIKGHCFPVQMYVYMPLPAYSVIFLHSVLSFLFKKTKVSSEYYPYPSAACGYFKIYA